MVRNAISLVEGKVYYIVKGSYYDCEIIQVTIQNNVFNYSGIYSISSSSTFFIQDYYYVELVNNTVLGLSTTGTVAAYNFVDGAYFVDRDSVFQDLLSSEVAVYNLVTVYYSISIINVKARNISCYNGACFAKFTGLIYGNVTIEGVTLDQSL